MKEALFTLQHRIQISPCLETEQAYETKTQFNAYQLVVDVWLEKTRYKNDKLFEMFLFQTHDALHPE